MRIDLAFAVPPGSLKSTQWHDGFTAGMELLAKEHEVRWLNLHPDADDAAGARRQLRATATRDVLLVKSNWGWMVDVEVRRALAADAGRKVILVSGTAAPPGCDVLGHYDVVLYQTPWYGRFVRAHPRTIQSFGIDTRIMCPEPAVEPDIDWLSVGKLAGYKRHERLLTCAGTRVVIGDTPSGDPRIRRTLRQAGVTVLPFVSYEDLADHYRRARNILVHCTINGGGERAVLEGRACGRPVHVAADNPKLRHLLMACPVWDHEHYGRTIGEGLSRAVAAPRRPQVGRLAFAVGRGRYAAALARHRLGRRDGLVARP